MQSGRLITFNFSEIVVNHLIDFVQEHTNPNIRVRLKFLDFCIKSRPHSLLSHNNFSAENPSYSVYTGNVRWFNQLIFLF